MPTSGDVVLLDFGVPQGHGAGFPRPAVVVTASDTLAEGTPVVQVVPLTTTLRGYQAEVVIEPDRDNGLTQTSSAQCQHIRSVAVSRLGERLGTLSPVHLLQVREVLGLLLDI